MYLSIYRVLPDVLITRQTDRQTDVLYLEKRMKDFIEMNLIQQELVAVNWGRCTNGERVGSEGC